MNFQEEMSFIAFVQSQQSSGDDRFFCLWLLIIFFLFLCRIYCSTSVCELTMSFDMATNPPATDEQSQHPSTVDDEAYEPTYAEAFPPLPPSVSSDGGDQSPSGGSAWPQVPSQWNNNNNSKMCVRSSVITQVGRNIYLTLWTPSNFLPNSCRRRLNF